MTRTRRWTRLLSFAMLAAGLALLAAACGGGAKKSSSATTGTSSGTSSTSSPAAPGGQRKFANFRLAYDTGIDFLDPGLSYTVEGWAIMWNTYLSLLGYKHVNGPAGATIVPMLAQNLPQVTPDGKTYTLTLRKGLKYSNGTAVKASDFKYAIKRLFMVNSPGVGFFTAIAGADTFSKLKPAAMKTGNISGIVTNDATGKITITLTAPRGDFQNILATVFAAPVPAGTPATNQSTTPIPATGPYMIQSYRPGRQAIVVRNPDYNASLIPDQPAGNPDKMTIDIVADDSAALQRVLNGQDDYDFHQIPPDRLSNIQQKYGSQMEIYTPANTYYFFVNARVKPFNDVRVRQAVNYGIDRQALVRIYGGLAKPTENILPPTYPSYKQHNLYPYNLQKAQQLVQQAGVKGMSVIVWNHDRGLDPKATNYLADQLNKMGFKASEKVINSSVYWTTIGNQATKAQIGFADWFQDYPHPLDWFDVLLNGERITATHNNNYSNFNIPAVNAKIDALKKESTLTSSVNAQWAALDQQVMQQGAWVPFINRQFTDFFGSKINTSCYVNHVLYQFDFSQICSK